MIHLWNRGAWLEQSKSTIRGARSGDKRERILGAAIQVFAEKGFFQAKISEIASVARVADGTIYLYFDNKDDLLIQVFEEIMVRFIDGLKEALEGSDEPADRIRRVIAHHLSMVEAHPDIAAVIAVELRQSPKFMKEYKNPKFAQYMRSIAAIIEEGTRNGTFRKDVDPIIAARALFGMLDEVVLSWVLLGRRFDLRHSAEQVQLIFMHGTRATE